MMKNRYSKLYVMAFSAFICVMILLGGFQNAEASSREGIAAIVNDDIVSFSDVRSRMRLNTVASNVPDTPMAQQRLQSQVLNSLIDEAVQLQEAKELGIVVTDEQIENEFSQIAQSNGYDLDTFKRAMAQKDVPLYTLREQIRSRIAWGQVVRRKLRSQINISESEIDAALDEEEKNAGKPEFLAAEIFLKVQNENDLKKVNQTANEIMKKLISGSLFSETAREYSDATGAVNGGNLGWVKSGQLMPELDNALNQMKPGQVSPPIRSAKGVHILFLRDARIMGEATNVAENTMPETVINNVPKTTMVHLKQIFIPVKKTDPATIVNAKLARAKSLSSEITTCSEMDARSVDFVSSATGDLGRIALESLSDKVVDIVNGLPVETLSDPLRNDRGVFVLMVCDREEISNDNIKTVDGSVNGNAVSEKRTDNAYRNKVANRLGMKRLDGLQRRYLKDLRATAFVDRRL